MDRRDQSRWGCSECDNYSQTEARSMWHDTSPPKPDTRSTTPRLGPGQILVVPSTNLLSIGHVSWTHRLLSVKSYLNTEAKFWENKQGKAISFMTPLLFTASITITIAKAAVSVQIRIATKFLTAVTKKSTVFSLELFNPVIWSFCCFTANCHLLKGKEKEF